MMTAGVDAYILRGRGAALALGGPAVGRGRLGIMQRPNAGRKMVVKKTDFPVACWCRS